VTSKKPFLKVPIIYKYSGKPVIIEGYDFLPEIYIKLISIKEKEITELEK